MKTKNFFSVLSLVLMFAAVTSATAGNFQTKKDQLSAGTMIRYQVNVVLSTEKQLCNLWLVKIVDENGRQVAPPKQYVPGVAGYDFFERGPVTGTRVAVLVKHMNGDHFICETELFTAPAILSGKFLNGESYRFDLFPSIQASRE